MPPQFQPLSRLRHESLISKKMTAHNTEAAQAAASHPAPGIPDYMLSPDAVLKDEATWRHGSAPDYSMTRKIWAETKKQNHASGSLASLVENLVKNWEIEASHKMKLDEWRTIDQSKYTFAINGGPPQDGEHMLKVGTYNAIITPNQYYDPGKTDLDKSHSIFRDMMPNFAWEVVEVYSPPPVVAFRWRHWGQMKRDYVGWNDKDEEVRIKAHGNYLDIQGITVARLNEQMKVTGLETWFDPVDMFIQMKPDLSKSEVEIDGKTLSMEEATSVLDHPRESGIEKIIDEVTGDSNPQSIAVLGPKTVQDGRDDVHLHHPSAPNQPHSEVRTSDDQISPAGHPESTSNGGSCPFLAADQRS